MAEKLSIQIALEGGKEIERQLADIGDAGQKAFQQIEQAASQVGGFKNIKPEEVTQKLKDLGVAGTDAFKKIQDAVASASRWERLVGAVQGVENAFAKVSKAAAVVVSMLSNVGTTIAAAAGALGAFVVSALKTAKAFNEINAAAMKAGLTFEEFDKLSLGFEKMGISAKDAAAGIQHFKEQLDKLNLESVNEALKELEEAAKRGFGARGTAQLALLEEAAKKVGKEGDAARKALEKLGLPIPPDAKTTLEQLGITTTDTAEAMQQFAAKLQQMPDSAERTALAFEFLGSAMGPKLIAFLQAGGGSVDGFFTNLNARTQEQAVQAARLEEAWNRLGSAWARFSGMTFSDTIIAGMDLLTASIELARSALDGVNDALGWLGELWAAIKADGVASWNAVTEAVNGTIGVINSLIEAIGNAINSLLQLLGLGTQVGGGNPVTGEGQGFAGGGTVGGRGTGTSDSNLAWVSRGEHIMPARAVRQPGVLAFLEALRRSGGNLRNVLDGMGRFALGGPVALPAFAGGGLNSMSNVTIQFPGLAPIGGLRAPADVVEELRKAAAMAQVRSGGTKPSRYR